MALCFHTESLSSLLRNSSDLTHPIWRTLMQQQQQAIPIASRQALIPLHRQSLPWLLSCDRWLNSSRVVTRTTSRFFSTSPLSRTQQDSTGKSDTQTTTPGQSASSTLAINTCIKNYSAVKAAVTQAHWQNTFISASRAMTDYLLDIK